MPQKKTTDTAVTSASAYRQKREQGTLWHAPSGAVVRIRDLDISDHAVIGQFPDNLQQLVYRQIEQSAKLRTTKAPDIEQAAASLFDGLSGKELLDSTYQLGVMCCKLGWMEPRVVDTVDDPDTEIGVDEIDAQDRTAFMARVFNGDEADAMATFPGQSQTPA